GFDPVALLDWEMAAVGPRELDVAWMIYLHRWFDDITEGAGMDPMRHFMRPEDVVARYEEASGVAVSADLRWYLFYAALRHGVIMFRVARRPILFGDAVMPADPDHLVMHHATLRRMLEGSYWEEFGV
ncbi:MAG TPA: hypothetical protein VGS21_01855, partial [Acidimicrobiales bacterium]|nr:hypothetical protein [Acidimicrobiales bacterium]